MKKKLILLICALLALNLGALAEQGVNIDNMVNKSRGEFAYTVLDLDDALSEETIRRVEALEPVYRARYFARV